MTEEVLQGAKTQLQDGAGGIFHRGTHRNVGCSTLFAWAWRRRPAVGLSGWGSLHLPGAVRLPAARHPHFLLYQRHRGCFSKLSFPFSKNLHWFLSGKSLLPLFLGVLRFLFFVPEMNVVSHSELSSVDSSCHGDG